MPISRSEFWQTNSWNHDADAVCSAGHACVYTTTTNSYNNRLQPTLLSAASTTLTVLTEVSGTMAFNRVELSLE